MLSVYSTSRARPSPSYRLVHFTAEISDGVDDLLRNKGIPQTGPGNLTLTGQHGNTNWVSGPSWFIAADPAEQQSNI
jgi:hypothetical protein